jgi:hypothetical protein
MPRSRSLVSGAVIFVVAAVATLPTLGRPLPLADAPPPGPTSAIDAPSHARAMLDTLWFGGTSPDGLGIEGAAWDFEDGTLQGWTSLDRSDVPLRARWSQRADFIADPVDGVISGLGSVWFGIHNVEAQLACYPGGQGYGNYWKQTAQKAFTYIGTTGIEISYRYFVDCETLFDFVHLEVETATGSAIIAGPYTGSVQEGTAIGSPTDAAEVVALAVPDSLLTEFEPFILRWVFVSDILVSDQLGSWPFILDSVNGPFGFDNFAVTNVDVGGGVPGTDLSQFTSSPDGWTFASYPASGRHLDVSSVPELDPPIPAGCILDDLDNDFVLTLHDGDGTDAHPSRQYEEASSPPIYVGPGSPAEGTTECLIRWNSFEAQSISDVGAGYDVSIHYYPWTCPITGEVGWTVHPAGSKGYLGGPHCGPHVVPPPTRAPFPIPSGTDSVRVVFTMLSDCSAFGLEDGCEETDADATPYLDDIQIGFITLVPEVIRVPEDIAGLHDAIEAAADRDTIEVGPGTYTGPDHLPLDFGGKDLVIRSASGPEVTILDAAGAGPVVIFDDREGPEARLEGFTIRGGMASSARAADESIGDRNTPTRSMIAAAEALAAARGIAEARGLAAGGGIRCVDASPVVRDCIIRDNAAPDGYGGGIAVTEGSPRFEACVISGNTALVAGGIGLDRAEVLLEDCLVTGNQSVLVGGVGVSDALVFLSGCTVTANAASNPDLGVGGIRAGLEGEVFLLRTILRDNCGPFADDGWIESDASLDATCANLGLLGLGFVIDGSATIDADTFFDDPIFCDTVSCTEAPTSDGNFGITEGSPCSAENSPCGELVGALPSCAIAAVDGASATSPTRLFPNVPNPFNPKTRIGYEVVEDGPVRITVFDVTGQRVRTLIDARHVAGRHEVSWDGMDDRGTVVASGVYFTRMEAGGTVTTRPMTLLR